MNQEQRENLENLISHIRDNAGELIDNTKIDNSQLFNAVYHKGIECLSNQSTQNIVDVCALILSYKIRKG